MRYAIAGLFIAMNAAAGAWAAGPDSVTFNKDVLPIFQQNCQTCHRPGHTGVVL
jgi:mono/diheme cytochrome c family protein